MKRQDSIYLAIVGDIVASRRISERAHWQRELEKLMVYLNTTYSDSIISKFVVTLGDEFQVLLKDTQALAGLKYELAVQPLPFSIRLGVGVGTIVTDIKPQAIGMDGPAFYRAREAVEWLKGHGGLFRAVTDKRDVDDVANSIAALCEAIQLEWTPRQREVYACSRQLGNQRSVANILQINPSAVSRTLKRMHVAEITQGEVVLCKMLDNLLTGGDGD